MGIQSLEIAPRVNHLTLLYVQFGKQMVDGTVPSAFVSVTPYIYTRMVHIAHDEFLHHPDSSRVVISGLPTGQFIKIKQADRIAHLQEMAVTGIVTTHSIHVHLLQQSGILQAHSRTECTPRLGMEAVTVSALHHQFGTVQIYAIMLAELNGAEAYLLCQAVSVLAQREGGSVEIGMLGIPCLGIGIHPTTLRLVISHFFTIDKE